ncbi:MAG: MFS transporter, partial [Bacilli bacterium]
IFVKDYNKDVSFSKKKNPFASLAKIKTLDKKLIIFLISLTMITIGSTNVSKYIDVYFDDLNLTTTALGNFVLATGLVSVATSIFIVPFFSKLRKQLVFIILIQVLSSVIIFYVFRANNFILTVYTVFMIYVIFKAIYLPLEQNYISRQADDDSIGTVMGIRQSFLSIGNVIGPLFGGMLYGIKPLVLFDSSGIFFLIGGFLLLIVLIIQKRETKLEN